MTKMRASKNNSSTSELQFELKYCERCGGLWLRPVGGPQVYCAGCARAMAAAAGQGKAVRSQDPTETALE